MEYNFKLSIRTLWHENPVLTQTLGLCPLLAVSNNVVNSLTLGGLTIIVMLMSTILVNLFRRIIKQKIRIPLIMILIASMTFLMELVLKISSYPLYLKLGIFIPLIITNCIVYTTSESSYKNNFLKASLNAFVNGLGFFIIILLIGIIREILGSATLFTNMKLLITTWQLSYVFNFNPLLILQSPAGAFLILALLVAMKNFLRK